MANSIARIINGQIVYLDDHAPIIKPNDTAARASREDQRVRYRKELLQKNEADYYRAYPEQGKNLSPELRRRFS
ncbi:hypothetical protein UFOVP253_31 [uncultured Caudovirales phage]|uniref:Uncharacterized protein n=1 Tax=uncultured Caudovirales phage TaxID=2100421 RepID=A0A6J5LEC4_9CAUD|nr:hypothetical protein UFOVP253_31 [uncultured Caudovirales phage]